MKTRKIAEDKGRKVEVIEMDDITRKLLPSLEAAVQEVKRIHGEKWPKCFGLIIARNDKDRLLMPTMIDSIDDISDKAELHTLKVSEEFLNI